MPPEPASAAPGQIQAQPTPFSWAIGKTSDGVAVVVELHLVTGVTRLFLTPDEARALADQLREQVSGLTIVQTIPTNGQKQ